VSMEFFIPLINSDYLIEKTRNTIGVAIPVSKKSALKPQLMYIKDKIAPEYQDLFILGGGYYYVL